MATLVSVGLYRYVFVWASQIINKWGVGEGGRGREKMNQENLEAKGRLHYIDCGN